MENRIREIEARLARLETLLGQSKPSVVSKPVYATTPRMAAPSVAVATPVSSASPGRWLGTVSVICFVLAAGFVIKLAIDSGWLTPIRQVGLAAIFGIALITIGLRLVRSDREYASYLPAAGVIVLYMSAFAAHRWHDLISSGFALVLINVVSAVCLGLSREIRNDLYVIIATVGSYLAPLSFGARSNPEFSLFYQASCSIVFSILSVFVESRAMAALGAYLAIGTSAWIGLLNEVPLAASLTLAFHFAAFTLATYFHTLRSRAPLTEEQAWLFFPVLLFFYSMEYNFIRMLVPGLAPWISLGFAGFLLILHLRAARSESGLILKSRTMILSFASIVVFHSLYLVILPDDVKPWLFAPMALALLGGSTRATQGLIVPKLLYFAVLAIEYLKMIKDLVAGPGGFWMGAAVAAYGSLVTVFLARRGELDAREQEGFLILASAHALAVAGLYRLGDSSGSLAVSALWLLYAAAIMAGAFVRKDQMLAKSALLVLSISAGKALLYDLSSAAALVRIACLALTGGVLYGCGFLLRRISSWSR